MIMATDLPRRPEPEATEPTVVDPTERVKSVADKANPRFEAARQRAEREDAARARARARAEAGGAEADDDADGDADETTDETQAPGAPFSFNMTGDAEEEKP